MDSLIIEGIAYRRRYNKPRQRTEADIIATNLLSVASGMGINFKSLLGGVDLPDGIDIVEEFGKIQRKESKLSSRQRKCVVGKFNNLYEEIATVDEDLDDLPKLQTWKSVGSNMQNIPRGAVVDLVQSNSKGVWIDA